jgi:hypothetical protein
MNSKLMEDKQIQSQLKLQRKRWTQQWKNYPDIVTWRERSATKNPATLHKERDGEEQGI